MKKVNILILFFIFLGLHSLCATETSVPQCNFFLNQIDSSSQKSFSSIQIINCDWEFYWDKTPEDVKKLVEAGIQPDATIKVPSYWNETASKITGQPTIFGKATYRVIVKNLVPGNNYGILITESPATSSAIYVDGKLVNLCGDPYELSRKESHSIIKPIYAQFTASKTGEAEITVFVHNYFYRIGGLWAPVQIGPDQAVLRYYNYLTTIYLFSLGILIFISLLTIIQFCLNPSQKQYLFLFIILFASITRVAVAGFNTLNLWIPSLSAESKSKIEYIAIWVIPLVYYLLLTYLYPKTVNKVLHFIPVKVFNYTYIIVNASIGISSLCLTPYLSTKMVPVLQVFALVASIFGFIIIAINIIRKRKYTGYHLFCIFNLLGGFVFDVIFESNKEVLKFSYTPFFFALFSIILLMMLSHIQDDTNKEIESISNDLTNTNLSYIRFVPLEFLSLLKKKSITNIKLGDHTSVEMAISFTKISIFDVKHSCIPNSETQYDIFCEYLKMISPYITRHGGFISKFLSGGLITLFPNKSTADDALFTSLKMVECLKEMQQIYSKDGIEINVFSGIHYGKMILGTIGDETRLDDTVISDTVNTTSRIESICEKMNKNVIISEDLLNLISPENAALMEFENLPSIPIKGKSNTLKLIACESKQAVIEQKITNNDDQIEELEEV